jgi:hypothetical protein
MKKLVQGEWYRLIMSKIQSNWVPTHSHKTINDLYEEIKSKIIKEFNIQKFLCQNSDGWKSIANDVANMHIIKHNKLLTINMDEGHATAEVISEKYKTIYKTFEILKLLK